MTKQRCVYSWKTGVVTLDRLCQFKTWRKHWFIIQIISHIYNLYIDISEWKASSVVHDGNFALHLVVIPCIKKVTEMKYSEF